MYVPVSVVWIGVLLGAGEPGAVTITKPSAAPAAGVRHYVVQLRIIEVDAEGRQTVIATPVLQTQGAAAGVTVEGDTGRRYEFHFSATEPGAPTPLPVLLGEDGPSPVNAMPGMTTTAENVGERKVTVKAVQLPRQQVLKSVAKQAGLKVAMEPDAVAVVAGRLATPITFEIDNAPLDRVIRQLVEPLELNYVVRDDLLLIGLSEPEASAPTDVSAGPKPIVSAPGMTAPGVVPPPAGEWQVRVYGVADLLAAGSASGLGEMAEHVQRDVVPRSWVAKGGQGTVRSFDSTASLVIRQTPAGHQAVETYLSSLRSRNVDPAKQAPPSAPQP